MLIYRVLHGIIQVALTVILLFNPSFEAILHRSGSDQDVIAGMAPFDPSLLDQISPDDLATDMLASIAELLKDQTITLPYFGPNNYTCPEGEGCFSYIIPGEFNEIVSRATLQSLAVSMESQNTQFVVKDTPVYQFDYLQLQEDFVFGEPDCQIYSSITNAIKVCLKNADGNLVAGIGC